ncbi:hypothetical protein Pelo_13238 [Pelomyxa schiedti]|nr:hypothetical protein Pelo_13238 [Pelomyxa schiedti]
MGCGWLGKEWLPRQQRHVILVCTCFQQFFMAGFVFGWPSLVSLLEKDGQYSELCDAISSEGNRSSEYPPPTWGSQSSSISTSSIPQSSSYVLRLCEAQELRFNLTITLAFVMTSLAGVVMGSVSDVIGPKLSNLVGGSLEIIGVALLSISDSKSFDAFLPAILLVAFGGTSLYYCNFHIVNMYPERRSLLIALTSIVFTVSGLSALIVQVR